MVKRTKRTKTNNSTKRCNNFCKNDYMKVMDKVMEQFNKIYKEPKLTKKQRQNYLKICKKTYCNEKCEGYDFYGDKKKQKQFQEKIKDGFQSSYSKDKIEMFKKRGALSVCVEEGDVI